LGMGRGGGGDVEDINYKTRIENCFKGTQSGDNLDFFGPNQKHYMNLVTFRKKFDSFPLIFARISMFEPFRDE
jgi:hypothetical protein